VAPANECQQATLYGLSGAVRTGNGRQPEAIDLVHAAAHVHHPPADVEESHRHGYILASKPR
jgi:hypothetical protein